MPRVPPAVFHTSTPLAPTPRVGGSGLVHMLDLLGRISWGLSLICVWHRFAFTNALCILW
jgi:hypothetical protein